MAGDSIEQAQLALEEVTSTLRFGDTFNIIKFGSHHEALYNKPKIVNRKTLQEARKYVLGINADMGGTQLGDALYTAYESIEQADILLITDGQVWGLDKLVAEAMDSGFRVFSVGVGSAVSEQLVRELALKTGGACELASPNEDMADVIVRQYDRIFQPPVKSIDITWPGKVIKQVPDKIASAFAGDTLHVFAELGSSTEEAIEVDVNYSTISINLTVLKSNVADDRLLNRIPMMYAAEQVESLSKDEATEMAVQHGLISKYTSYSLVCDDMKIEGADIPELVTIPNEVPAGWGGAGSVVRACVSNSLSVCESGSGYQVDYLDIPAFLRRQSEDQPKFRLLSRFAEKLNSYYQRRSGVDLHHDTIQDLRN